MNAKEVKSMNIKRVVDNPEWQVLRKKLIGNWINNHTYNVDLLREYFERDKSNPLVVRRVLNVLTGSVHRTKKTFGQVETDLLRRDVRITWRNMLGEDFDSEDPKYLTGVI